MQIIFSRMFIIKERLNTGLLLARNPWFIGFLVCGFWQFIVDSELHLGCFNPKLEN